MKKHKQGMFSAADKKLVRENTPKSAQKKGEMAKKMPNHYKGNSHSEGGIAFGRPPKGEK